MPENYSLERGYLVFQLDKVLVLNLPKNLCIFDSIIIELLDGLLTIDMELQK